MVGFDPAALALLRVELSSFFTVSAGTLLYLGCEWLPKSLNEVEVRSLLALLLELAPTLVHDA